MVVDEIKSFFGKFSNKSAFFPVILAIILVFLDINMGFAGFTMNSYNNFLRVFPNVLIPALIAAGYVLIYLILAGGFKVPAKTTFIFVLAFFLSTLIFFYGGVNTFWHMFFVALIVAFTQDGDTSENKALWYIAIILLDFVFLSLLNFNSRIISEGALYYLIPTPLIYALGKGITYESSSILSTLYKILLVALLLILMFNGWDNWRMYNEMKTLSPDALKSDVKSAWQLAWENAKTFGTELRKAIMSPFNTSSYDYSGKQEETKNPQGVYLNEIEKGDMLFFEETPALLWAVLEARTLEKAIDKVSVKCTTELEDGTIMEGIVNEGTTKYDFPVYSGVDRPLSCRFDELLEGNYEAKFSAEFDFTTESRQLIYLMDRTRYTEEIIALRRQGKSASPDDVLRSVDIAETKPDSIYTSGPVAVKIGTNSFPWDIGDTNNILYRFGVEINNEWTRGGEILKINKIRFVMPSTFSIVDNSCGVKIKLTALGANVNTGAGEKVYETIEEITDVEDERIINCLIYLDKSSLDKGVEVTRRYLKAEVDYTYLMEQETQFEVEKLHDELDTMILDKDNVCCLMDTDVYEKKPKTECTKVAPASKCYNECCKLSKSGSNDQYKWVESAGMCDSFDSTYTSASLVENKALCPKK